MRYYIITAQRKVAIGFRTIAVAFFALFFMAGFATAQPITRPAPFTLSASDTSQSDILPSIEKPAGTHGPWHLSPEGHYTAKDGTHLKFFGTEINWTANFISSDQAKTFAKRLSKMGFNALRLNYYDYFGWDDASIFHYLDDKGALQGSSYVLNPLRLAQLDTLLAALKHEGIYTFFPLNTYHHFSTSEGVATWDSMYTHGDVLPFIDPAAASLEAAWAKTILTHVNPLTGISYGNDPSIACYELLQEQSLSYFWQLNRLNFVNPANALSAGLATISYSQSRRIDTLFSQYLSRKYNSDQALARAWSGPVVVNAPNLIKNGSFESFDNSNWTLAVNPPAHATLLLAADGQDATPAELIHIPSVDTTHSLYAIDLLNASAVTGKDSLYQYSFYAKIRYNPVQGIRQRSIIGYIAGANGVQSLVSPVTIDTNWQRYTFNYRSASSGLQYVGLLMAGELGDVMCDRFELHRVGEKGLGDNESISNATVYRISYDSAVIASPYRVRDLAMFYDSLQQNFYHRMSRLLRDTLQTAGLINFSQANYWGLIPTYHAYKDEEVTELHTGWDYVSGRPDGIYADSSWEIRNTAMVHAPSTYALTISAAASVAGKAHVVGWSTPSANQNSSENGVIPVIYAAYQDWDGFFFTPYAVRREELFPDTLIPGFNSYAWNNIASNHALMALMPSASEVFRKGRVAPAGYFDTIRHDADDAFLFAHFKDYRGPFSQEGFAYGDEGIITSVGVREQYDSPTHQLAAENTYTPGDTLNRSEDGRIMWDGTHGAVKATEPDAYVYAGLPTDTISFPRLKILRTDGSHDILSMYYLLSKPTLEAKHNLLTLSTRVQNSNTIWSDSLSFGKNSGKAPTIMSAVKAQIVLQSDMESVTIYPLDSTGNRTNQQIPMQRIASMGAGNWYSATIDQQTTRSMWFEVLESGTNAVANSTGGQHLDLTIAPNPIATRSTITLSLPTAERVSVTLIDDLGREIRTLASGAYPQGNSAITLDASTLPSGHYIVRVLGANGVVTRNLTVIR